MFLLEMQQEKRIHQATITPLLASNQVLIIILAGIMPFLVTGVAIAMQLEVTTCFLAMRADIVILPET